MNIQKLEKLNELKEKGILSKEEFEKQKQELLVDNKGNNPPPKGINWKNFWISFIISLFWSFIVEIACFVVDDSFTIFVLLLVLSAIGLTIVASKLETKKYKNCCPAWEIFIGILLLRGLGVWIASYEFLQIKQGNAVLKDKK